MRFCSLFLVVLSFASVVRSAEPQAERQYLVKLKVCQGKADAKPGDPSIKVLSAPQVMTLEGKSCSFHSGGEILLPDFGTKAVEHADTGIHAVLNCRKADDESVRLNLKLNYATVTNNQSESFVLSENGAHVLVKAKLNTPVKTVLHEKEKIATWVEVSVEDVTKME